MIRCPHCKSYFIECDGYHISPIKPLPQRYVCKDCGKYLTISDRADINLSVSKDVTRDTRTDILYDFFNEILEERHLPQSLDYREKIYNFLRVKYNNYYYYDLVEGGLIHLHIKKRDIIKAMNLFDERNDFVNWRLWDIQQGDILED
jgi:hypothetical protein